MPHLRFAPYSPTAATVLLVVVATPLVWSLWGAVSAGLHGPAWLAMLQDPQTLRALGLSLWTGLLSTALATAVTAWVLSAHTTGQRTRWLAPMLAVPHAAFAIGLVALLAPSGWIVRALSPWATGLEDPPPWTTTQDPWGLGLIAVLVFKEVPFLLWAAATST